MLRIILIAAVFLSCSRKDIEIPIDCLNPTNSAAQIQQLIKGRYTWALTESFGVGGIPYQVYKPETIGYRYAYEFKSNRIRLLYEKEVLKLADCYDIETASDQSAILVISRSGAAPEKYSIKLCGDSAWISPLTGSKQIDHFYREKP